MAKDALAKARELNWDEFTATTKGLKVATKTAQGIGFAFTSDGTILTMCDDAGLYTPRELAGCIKKYGNFSDYDTGRIVAHFMTSDCDMCPLDDIKSELLSTPSRGIFTPAAQTTIAAADWNAIFEELKPFIETMQSLLVTKIMKN